MLRFVVVLSVGIVSTLSVVRGQGPDDAPGVAGKAPPAAPTLAVDEWSIAPSYWRAPISGAWSDPQRWNHGTVPPADSHVHIDRMGAYTVDIDVAISLKSFAVNAPVDLYVNNKSVTIGNRFALYDGQLYASGCQFVGNGSFYSAGQCSCLDVRVELPTQNAGEFYIERACEFDRFDNLPGGYCEISGDNGNAFLTCREFHCWAGSTCLLSDDNGPSAVGLTSTAGLEVEGTLRSRCAAPTVPLCSAEEIHVHGNGSVVAETDMKLKGRLHCDDGILEAHHDATLSCDGPVTLSPECQYAGDGTIAFVGNNQILDCEGTVIVPADGPVFSGEDWARTLIDGLGALLVNGNVILRNDIVSVPTTVGAGGQFTFLDYGNECNAPLFIGNDGECIVDGRSYNGHVKFNGGVLIDGRLTLTGSNSLKLEAPCDGYTVGPDGLIQVEPGGPTTLAGGGECLGSFVLGRDAVFDLTTCTWKMSEAALTVLTGKTVTIKNGNAYLGPNTALSGYGTVDLVDMDVHLVGPFTIPSEGPSVRFGEWSRVTVNGEGPLNVDGSLDLTYDILNVAMEVHGDVNVLGYGNEVQDVTVSSEGTLAVDGAIANAHLLAESIENDGNIILTDNDGGTNTVTLETIAMFNRSGGVITAEPSVASFPRSIKGPINNAGAIVANEDLKVDARGGSVDSRDGDLAVAEGRTMTITNGRLIISSATGQEGGGTVAIENASVNLVDPTGLGPMQWEFPGQSTLDGDGPLINRLDLTLNQDWINVPVTNEGSVTFEQTGNVVSKPVTNVAGGTVIIDAGAGNAHVAFAELVACEGDSDWYLRDSTPGAANITVEMNAGGIFNGNILAEAHQDPGLRTVEIGGPLTITGTLESRSTLLVVATDDDAPVDGSTATIVVDSGAEMIFRDTNLTMGHETGFGGTGDFVLEDVNVNVVSPMTVGGDGTITWVLRGDTKLEGSALDIQRLTVNGNTVDNEVAVTGDLNILATGNTFNGDVAVVEGATTTIDGTDGNADVIFAVDFGIHGTLKLKNDSGDPRAITMTGTNGLHIFEDGELVVEEGGGGARFINAGIDTEGLTSLQTSVQCNRITMESTSTIEFVLDGTREGRPYIETGFADLGGTCQFRLADGYAPQEGDEFVLISTPNQDDEFEHIKGRILGDGLIINVYYDDERLEVIAKVERD